MRSLPVGGLVSLSQEDFTAEDAESADEDERTRQKVRWLNAIPLFFFSFSALSAFSAVK